MRLNNLAVHCTTNPQAELCFLSCNSNSFEVCTCTCNLDILRFHYLLNYRTEDHQNTDMMLQIIRDVLSSCVIYFYAYACERHLHFWLKMPCYTCYPYVCFLGIKFSNFGLLIQSLPIELHIQQQSFSHCVTLEI